MRSKVKKNQICNLFLGILEKVWENKKNLKYVLEETEFFTFFEKSAVGFGRRVASVLTALHLVTIYKNQNRNFFQVCTLSKLNVELSLVINMLFFVISFLVNICLVERIDGSKIPKTFLNQLFRNFIRKNKTKISTILLPASTIKN